ncbi:hypothetical protein JTB14_002204 [Gonioctena quinquepunctata]|nr:hypothetical protein JTB14_002204 [Gonioctena quinquepunctata]
MTQLLNLKDHELDCLAKFMGHDIRVHTEYYRLSDETTQLAKISKLLISLDKGDFNRLKGKNLDEIDIDDFVQDRDESESNYDKKDSHQETLVVPENNDPASNISDVNPPTEKTSIMSLPNDRTIQNMKPSTSHKNGRKIKKIINSAPTKRQGIIEKTWSLEEKTTTEKYFKDYLSIFISENSDILINRQWKNVKDFLYNILKEIKLNPQLKKNEFWHPRLAEVKFTGL